LRRTVMEVDRLIVAAVESDAGRDQKELVQFADGHRHLTEEGANRAHGIAWRAFPRLDSGGANCALKAGGQCAGIEPWAELRLNPSDEGTLQVGKRGSG